VRSLAERPPGFRLTGHQVVRIARSAAAAKGVSGGGARVWTRGSDSWRVSLYEGGAEKAQVYVDDATGRATETWTGRQVDTYLARGYSGQFVGKLNAPWLWLPLCLMFVLPFVDPRRPFRLLHLDLLVLVGALALLLRAREHRRVGAPRLSGARLRPRAPADRRLPAARPF
jgi:hypothetical protein